MKRTTLTIELKVTQFTDNDTFHYNIRFPELDRGVASFQPVDEATLKTAIGAATVAAAKELL